MLESLALVVVVLVLDSGGDLASLVVGVSSNGRKIIIYIYEQMYRNES